MKNVLKIFAFFLFPATMFAQTQTAVTGTITDNNSVPYYPATITACLTPVTLYPTVSGKQVNTNQGANYCVGPVATAPSGSFTMYLWPNANITPSSTQWNFTVYTPGTAQQDGVGAVSFSAAATISGTSQNISTTLTSVAPNLLRVTSPNVGIRQIATRSIISSQVSGTATNAMSRNWHIAKIAPGTLLTSVQVVVGNWYATETATGATKTATCAIEYPAGTYNQCKFGGATSVVVANGGTALSDVIQLSVPIPSGAMFWERYFYTNASGVDFTNRADSLNDVSWLSNSATDLTVTNSAITNTVAGDSAFLYAIIGYSTVPAVCIVGDSRAYGFNDAPGNASTASTGPYVGSEARQIGPFFAFINESVSGESATNFVVTHTLRVALSQYCSHIINSYGINDIRGSVTAATLEGLQQTIAGYFPGKPYFMTTLIPNTTSTDSWATLANQTPIAQEAARQTYNAWLRTSAWLPWCTDIFDDEPPVVSSVGAATWKVNGTANFETADGLHANQQGYQDMQNSDVINPYKIHF